MSQPTSIELMEMRNVLVLAAFAAEARRVLDGIELADRVYPEVGEKLGQVIEARRQWTLYDDTLSQVLNSVAERLEGMYAET